MTIIISKAILSLTQLPDEVILVILSHLPVSDLLQCSRTCHLLRHLSTDPILHHIRFQQATADLHYSLSKRASRASISPPQSWIRLTKTHLLSRAISRSLTKIRLNHRLESRPSARDLVHRAILPEYAGTVSPALVQSQRAIHKSHLRYSLTRALQRRPSITNLVSLNIMPEECVLQISPALIETRRQVIKATLKDGLRAWVESRGLKAQQRRASELDEAERKTVRMLVRKLTARRVAAELEGRTDRVGMEKKVAVERWGRELERARAKEREMGEEGCRQPTRARVLALKRFWEGVVGTAK